MLPVILGKRKTSVWTVKLKQIPALKEIEKQRIESEEGKQSKNEWIKESLSNISFHE